MGYSLSIFSLRNYLVGRSCLQRLIEKYCNIDLGLSGKEISDGFVVFVKDMGGEGIVRVQYI